MEAHLNPNPRPGYLNPLQRSIHYSCRDISICSNITIRRSAIQFNTLTSTYQYIAYSNILQHIACIVWTRTRSLKCECWQTSFSLWKPKAINFLVVLWLAEHTVQQENFEWCKFLYISYEASTYENKNCENFYGSKIQCQFWTGDPINTWNCNEVMVFYRHFQPLLSDDLPDPSGPCLHPLALRQSRSCEKCDALKAKCVRHVETNRAIWQVHTQGAHSNSQVRLTLRNHPAFCHCQMS